MTAPEKLMQLLVFKMTGERVDDPAAVRERHSAAMEDDGYWDAESEVRGGTEKTGLPCDYSRHYEARAVAAQMLDGSWVGWTYWYGGGKHGEPGGVPWIEDAYDVVMTEERRVVRVFTRLAADPGGGR